MTQPALSPDGGQIAFASAGAIWTVAARGGPARLLVSGGASDSRPVYSPDGQWLAFESTRTGGGDIYVLSLASNQLHRLTWSDGPESLDGWSPDSRWIYFSSSQRNIHGMNDIYRVPVSGGTPLEVSAERYVTQYDAAAAPDGHSLAVVTLGEMGLGQWWRNGHAHIDNTEIWRVTPANASGAKTGYERILPTGDAKNLWPMWSPDGKTLYFMSDRSGAENLWELPPSGTPRALTHFTSGRALWPAIGARGKQIVFERDFGIWRLDLGSHEAQAVPIELVGAANAASLRHESVTDASDLAVSPDGKKLAFVAHGEVFATNAEHGGEAVRITNTGKDQFDLVWSPDSRHLAYVSDRDGNYHLFQYDFQTNQEEALTRGNGNEGHIAYAPDGKQMVFLRGIGDVVVLNLESKQEKVVAQGYLDGPPPLTTGGLFAWSPDSRYIAFLDQKGGLFPNAWVVPAAGGTPRQVSFLANSYDGELNWSPDGKYLLFQTAQRTEPSRIARVDLTLETPLFREDIFHDLFEVTPRPRGGRNGNGEEGAPKPPVATPPIVYDGIAQRVELLPMLNARSPRISPDGKWLAYIGSEGGSSNIYVVSLDEKAPLEGVADAPTDRAPKQLTSTRGGKSDLQFTADSKGIYYLEGRKIHRVPVAGGAAKPVSVTAGLDVNFAREKEEVFEQAWRYLRDNYQNPEMNGSHWDAVRARYAPEVAAAVTEGDLNWVLSEMIGDLNSSHSGIRAPANGGRPATGRLGLFFDRVKYENSGQLCVTEVVPMGPAALAGVAAGDCLAKVNGTAIAAGVNLDQALNETIDQKTELQITTPGGPRTVAVKPVNSGTVGDLLYDGWVEHNRQLVDKLSGGKLGYIHMADMSQGALDKLYMDLNSTAFGREGVVVDVRNNNGGFVNAYALDVLTRKPYLTMVPRGFPQGPARVALGQRALEKPTVLLTNQNTLSDGEDFTEGYETMHLGQVVGLPTAGWIIYTSNVPLIDGSVVRLPSTRVLDHNGKDMELHPRPVDVTVANPLGSWQDGKDPQLAAAVKTLLAQIQQGPERHIAGSKGDQHE